VIEINPEALEIADRLDHERREKTLRGPLHGIPVLLKDNIETSDRMSTTAGSLALLGSRPAADSFVVQKLRQAGAVILGKTNLSEWANIRSSHSTSGWSGRGGLTRNPYALDRNPCGSSSGSGAAVAASLCAAAVGTETDGSVVCPSSANGLVGMKPTVGLLSRSGIIPIAHSQDTPGPMARTTRDLAILLSALAGIDPCDPSTAESAGKAAPDYTTFLDADGLRGARIGVARKYFGISDAVDRLMSEAIDAMKHQGAVLVDPADLASHGKFDDTELTVFALRTEGGSQHLSGQPSRSSSAFARRTHCLQRAPPGQGNALFWPGSPDRSAIERPPDQPRIFERARDESSAVEKGRHRRRDGQISAGCAHCADRRPVMAHRPGEWRPRHRREFECRRRGWLSGYHRAHGFVFGMPVGISFFGRAWTEPTLLKLAYSFEQATKVRKPPQFLPTVKL